MQNKNSKSKNHVVREAENIIEKYLNDREMSDIKKYYDLKEKEEYDIKIEEKTNIKINKYSKGINLKYIELN